MNNKSFHHQESHLGMRRHIFHIVLGALIAAVYMAVTLALAPFSYGMVQLRLSEVLTILPALTPAAIPGLAIGCFLANLFNPNSLGLVDIIGGTFATTLAAVVTRIIAVRLNLHEESELASQPLKLSQRAHAVWLTLPSIVFNALIVGTYLMFLFEAKPAQTFGRWLIYMGSVGLGQLASAGIGGLILYFALAPFMKRLYQRFRAIRLKGAV